MATYGNRVASTCCHSESHCHAEFSPRRSKGCWRLLTSNMQVLVVQDKSSSSKEAPVVNVHELSFGFESVLMWLECVTSDPKYGLFILRTTFRPRSLHFFQLGLGCFIISCCQRSAWQTLNRFSCLLFCYFLERIRVGYCLGAEGHVSTALVVRRDGFLLPLTWTA